jgi:hypothetical protein
MVDLVDPDRDRSVCDYWSSVFCLVFGQAPKATHYRHEIRIRGEVCLLLTREIIGI